MSCMLQSDDQISHLLPLTDMSRCGRCKETPLQVTCELPYVSSNANGDCKTRKVLPNCFACYNQFNL